MWYSVIWSAQPRRGNLALVPSQRRPRPDQLRVGRVRGRRIGGEQHEETEDKSRGKMNKDK